MLLKSHRSHSRHSRHTCTCNIDERSMHIICHLHAILESGQSLCSKRSCVFYADGYVNVKERSPPIDRHRGISTFKPESESHNTCLAGRRARFCQLANLLTLRPSHPSPSCPLVGRWHQSIILTDNRKPPPLPIQAISLISPTPRRRNPQRHQTHSSALRRIRLTHRVTSDAPGSRLCATWTAATPYASLHHLISHEPSVLNWHGGSDPGCKVCLRKVIY